MTHSFPARGRVLLLAVLWLAISGTVAVAQDRSPDQTVQVVADSPFSESDPAAMRDKAIQKGLEEAVLQVAAEKIGRDVFAGNEAAIRATLMADPQRYIANYRVLEETRDEENYQVVVQATVSVSMIEDALRRSGTLASAEPLPKVLFLTSQQNLEDVVPRYWWSGTAQDSDFVAENAMMAALSENGFEVVSRDAPDVRTAAASIRFIANPEDQKAVDFGMRLGADVVVVGQSTAQATSGTGAQGPRTFTATASLRALEIPSGSLLTEVTETFVTVDTDDRAGGLKALAGVGERSGGRLVALLRPAWQNRTKKASVLRMEVEGTRALADFVRFRQILKATEGVRGIRIESLKADQAVVAVEADGNARALAEKLMANNYPSFAIEIYAISGKGLKVRLIKAGGSGGAM